MTRHSISSIRRHVPLVISVVALGVSIGTGVTNLRVGNAADPQVTDRQRQTLVSLQDAFSSIAEAAEPAVVNIQVEPAPAGETPETNRSPNQRDATPPRDLNPFENFDFPFGPFNRPQMPGMPSPRQAPSTGSGVIVNRTGNEYFLLTNYHVVEGGGRIKVQVHGLKQEARGTLVGQDEKTDLAVVKIRLPNDNNPRRVAEFADSSSVRVGQWAIAIGNPLGVGQTLTVGVVSAKGRSINRIQDSLADYSDMIQTDASINPGNSGGALVDINGNLIGINTAIASTTRGSIGIGFAIPSNTAKYVSQELIRHGEVVRGWLGVQTYQPNWEIQPEIARQFGVDRGAFIDKVNPDTPASRAGIRSEDIIVKWGDTPINNYRELTEAVGSTPPGQKVKIDLYRGGKPMSVTVVTEKRPDEASLQGVAARRPNSPNDSGEENAAATVTVKGVTIRALAISERQSVGSDGVFVTEVNPGTMAGDAGLSPGTVIHRVNQTPVSSVSDFKSAMAKIRSTDSYVLRISRPTGANTWGQMTVVVDPEE